MAFKDLREFIATLEKQGEVQKVSREVHWNLELGAILRRTYEQGLPAPFFQKIKGYPESYRVFGGTLGNQRRVAIALGMNPESSYNELMEEYLKRSRKPIKPVMAKDAPCKENIYIGDKVNLLQFPAPMLHEGDGGRYLCTWHANITKDPDSDWVNWGMYRAMIHTKNTLGGLFEPHAHIGMHYKKYESRKQPMPFAIAIGPEPVCGMCACTKIPYGVSEVDVAGGLRGEPVEIVKCETVDIEVPATSEIVIEGEVLPREREWEGPFGEFTGYRASPRDRRPVYRVKAITHRNNPILAVSCMGVPIDDCHAPMSITSGAEVLAELRTKGLPVVGLRDYAEAAGMLLVISVKAGVEANLAQRVANAVWASHAGRTLSYVVIVEDDIDPGNIFQVMHALGSKCHPVRGIQKQEFAPGHALQPFLNLHERLHRLGACVYFDCTWPLDWDPSIAVPPRASFDKIYPKDVQQYVLDNWRDYGFKK